MAAVAREAARRGCASLVLEVAEDNSVAGALYAGLGFAAVGRRSGYYRRADGRAADAMILRWRIADEPPGAGEPA
jgi:ribosomal-protein-alanine N-acetyltransferase